MQKGGDKLGYESEAFAIYDTMKYIKPEVHTLCVGTAFGESAMLLAAGTPVGLLLQSNVSPNLIAPYSYIRMQVLSTRIVLKTGFECHHTELSSLVSVVSV